MPSFPRRISGPYPHPFSVAAGGVYAITIVATCRSGTQIDQHGGEDLRVEIDGMALREIPPLARKQEYDIPPAWSGTQLRGLPKTAIFVLRLSAGDHTLNFVPYRGAEILAEPKVDLIADPRSWLAIANTQAEDGDRRPWYTIALVNVPLRSISLDATAQWRWRDSDDLKLVVDGAVKPNPSRLAILRKDWLFSGSVLKWLRKSQQQHFAFEENLPIGIHYFELWADRQPRVHVLKIDLGDTAPSDGGSQHQATITDPGEEITEVHIRIEATTRSSALATIPVGERVELLVAGVQGDHVPGHTDRWHQVRYNQSTGYILSSYVDIDGQATADVQQIMRTEAARRNIPPEYVLALAECESHFKPYAVSEADARGVMQLSPQLLVDLNDSSKPFYSPVDNPFDIEQNIRAGVAYFAYLYSRYKDDPQQLEKTIAAYNAGPGHVPVGEPLQLSLYDQQTQRLVSCVQIHLRDGTF